MYAMGLKTEQEMTDAMQAAMNQETIENRTRAGAMRSFAAIPSS